MKQRSVISHDLQKKCQRLSYVQTTNLLDTLNFLKLDCFYSRKLTANVSSAIVFCYFARFTKLELPLRGPERLLKYAFGIVFKPSRT